ncbi:MAG TPA: MBL fold metallo-hydrolase [Tepidisphaeraceae bacterium]|nr:MBL fold metallo-hydrolase [Tepidisphaeraceae bacterium]
MAVIELLFLGSGTSAGVPMIGCHCPVCTSSDPHDRRDRPSVLISYNGSRVLVDATPELRHQCLRNQIDMIDAIVFTHAHADHIFGLDDVRRFNAIKKGPIDVWADAKTFQALDKTFSYAFRSLDVDVRDFRPHLVKRFIERPFEIARQTWTPIPLLHGDMTVLGFRVGDLAYCTDVSEIPESSFELLKGLDVLVLDALAQKEHPRHFSVAQAVEAATRISARQTWFTHIGHQLSHEETNQMLPVNMRLAYDGLRVQAK